MLHGLFGIRYTVFISILPKAFKISNIVFKKYKNIKIFKIVCMLPLMMLL
ncbi:hypothetical protein QFZ31_001595 [Neobacillus niacini]|jgi:hypothetical protein|nr:hypothetical protein [Neobacillus niacini]